MENCQSSERVAGLTDKLYSSLATMSAQGNPHRFVMQRVIQKGEEISLLEVRKSNSKLTKGFWISCIL